ncbi:hypothetical protein K402DRAFT_392468 [Aulographum hederae CBS 113979]|uniref:Uncharacterized protein n=1 Tax=Aulographum hederae CBS 113979 TaxID=1176131 RepID=A0A6G1H3M5_9PEZI|nr:hypothetical protein K402DRAFT_392468 [Aulographum hederae CBS 113979]
MAPLLSQHSNFHYTVRPAEAEHPTLTPPDRAASGDQSKLLDLPTEPSSNNPASFDASKLVQTTIKCCRCMISFQPPYSCPRHPLGKLLCPTCHTKSCSHCTIFPSGLELLEANHMADIIPIDGSNPVPLHGFVCCLCGISQPVSVKSMRREEMKMMLGVRPKTGMKGMVMVKYKHEVCSEKGCEHDVCEGCIKYKILDEDENSDYRQ